MTTSEKIVLLGLTGAFLLGVLTWAMRPRGPQDSPLPSLKNRPPSP